MSGDAPILSPLVNTPSLSSQHGSSGVPSTSKSEKPMPYQKKSTNTIMQGLTVNGERTVSSVFNSLSCSFSLECCPPVRIHTNTLLRILLTPDLNLGNYFPRNPEAETVSCLLAFILFLFLVAQNKCIISQPHLLLDHHMTKFWPMGM